MAIDRGAISRTQDTTFVFSDGCRAVRLAVNLRCPHCDAARAILVEASK